MSKKYYWNWTVDGFMDEDINQFLEVGSKKNNEWWKNLPSTVPSLFKTHLEVFKDLASHYFATGETTELQSTATAKTCPALTKGLLDKILLVKLPCDLYISVNPEGAVYWNFHNDTSLELSTHPTGQFYSTEKNPFYNKINIKFTLPIVFSSNKDTYMFLQPQLHQQNYPFEVVNGSVNADRIKLAVNTLISIPKEQTEYHIKAGTILAYMWFDNSKIKLEKNSKLKWSHSVKFFGN